MADPIVWRQLAVTTEETEPTATVTPVPKTLLYSTDFSTDFGTWVAVGGGTWTVDGGLVSPASTVGYGSQFCYPFNFSLDQRTTRVLFQVLGSGATVGIGYRQGNGTIDGGVYFESLYFVDATANTLNIGNAWNGTTNPGVLKSVALGFTITVGNTYIMEITIAGRKKTVSVTDPVTAITATLTVGDNATDTGIAPAGGAQMDVPVVVAIAGRMKITKFSILANVVNPHVYIPGDSLTYGYLVPFTQRWASLLAARAGTVAVSGRPSATTTAILNIISTEFQFINPAVVLLLIGTNDMSQLSRATYLANVTSIINQVKAKGSKIILGIFPPSTAFNASEYAARKAALLAMSVDGFWRADLALTTNNDGVTPNATLLQSDGVHWNSAGSIAAVNRFAVDVPWIYD